jgi:hypothetical protein
LVSFSFVILGGLGVLAVKIVFVLRFRYRFEVSNREKLLGVLGGGLGQHFKTDALYFSNLLGGELDVSRLVTLAPEGMGVK